MNFVLIQNRGSIAFLEHASLSSERSLLCETTLMQVYLLAKVFCLLSAAFIMMS